MYRLELRLAAADKESAAERLRIQRLEDYRRALHAEDRKTVREWKQRAAAYDGTSVIKRKEEKERLTELNQSFHRRMTTFRWANIYNQRNNITDAKRLQRLRDEMDTFLTKFPNDKDNYYMKFSKARKLDDNSYVSEDTKRLEVRPYKHDCDHNANLDSHYDCQFITKSGATLGKLSRNLLQEVSEMGSLKVQVDFFGVKGDNAPSEQGEPAQLDNDILLMTSYSDKSSRKPA
ncbi:unnamed protein product [Rhizophagus irregularis]|nr:unnamed protein product [Rhizophagus irregularis]